MRKINWSRVFLGGLVAGVIINLFEFVTNGVFLAAQWESMMRPLGRTTFPSVSGTIILGLPLRDRCDLAVRSGSSPFRTGCENGCLDWLRLLGIDYFPMRPG